ncbi:hypothetical protein [Aquimarina rhabdastrellae]
MITLKDYIGGLHKEITNAKVQSDIETLMIAEEYAKNPLLKHFSVPNIRMKNIELDIPVAIDTVNPPIRDKFTEEGTQKVYVRSFEKAYINFYPQYTATPRDIEQEVTKHAQEVAKVFIAEYDKVSDIESRNELIKKYANVFARNTHQFVERVTDFNTYNAYLYPVINEDLKTDETEIENVPVIVESRLLKEINDNDSMIKIKMTVYDDAMTWTTEADENGNSVPVLTYE